jgi:hypothetical protein
MSYRFMFEALPCLVAASAAGVALLPKSERFLVTVAGVCLALSFMPPYLEHTYGMQSTWEMNRYVYQGREAGRRLKEVLPPDTVISTTLAGTIPYFSGLVTIDEWGLNDRYIASQRAPELFRRGHLKSAPGGYLWDRGVNLIVGHPTVCSCETPCVEWAPHVFVRLSGDRCLRTTYLVQKPELTRYFCADPAEFILSNVACP